jgi:hypothetical protein
MTPRRRLTPLHDCERLKALHPEIFTAGELAGLGKLPPGQRERGGQPLGFSQWPGDRRNAWFAGFNVGYAQRRRATANTHMGGARKEPAP